MQPRLITFIFLSSSLILQKTAAFPVPESAYDTDNFTHLLLHSPLFVDKTLLVNEFLQHDESYFAQIVTRPKGWGKSTNLHMLEKFFEIEVDEKGDLLPKEKTINDKLFLGGTINLSPTETKQLEPLKIKTFSNVTAYLGKHPVILLRLKTAIAQNYQDMEQWIKACVVQVFKRHEYLTHSTKITHKAEFEKYLKGDFNTTELRDSLHFLGLKLKEHFEKDVFLLVDDYDVPLISAYTDFEQVEDMPESKKAVELIRYMLSAARKRTKEIPNDIIAPTRRKKQFNATNASSTSNITPDFSITGAIEGNTSNTTNFSNITTESTSISISTLNITLDSSTNATVENTTPISTTDLATDPSTSENTPSEPTPSPQISISTLNITLDSSTNATVENTTPISTIDLTTDPSTSENTPSEPTPSPQDLKRNTALLTGILDLSFENPETQLAVEFDRVHTLFDTPFARHYGFTHDEVQHLLTKIHKAVDPEQLKLWYNGYNYRYQHEEELHFYNPRSIIRSLLASMATFAYYGDGGYIADHGLVYNTLSADEIQEDVQLLISSASQWIGGYTYMTSNIRWERTNIPEVLSNKRTILLFHGLLGPCKPRLNFNGPNIGIPNRESRCVYETNMMRWICRKFNTDANDLRHFVGLLSTGLIKPFGEHLQKYLSHAKEFVKADEYNAKVSYGGLMMAVKKILTEQAHNAEELKENGQIRLMNDILLVPKSYASRIAIIIQYKIVKNEKNLTSAAEAVLEEINKRYRNGTAVEIPRPHVRKIYKLGMAFCGDKVEIKYEIRERGNETSTAKTISESTTGSFQNTTL